MYVYELVDECVHLGQSLKPDHERRRRRIGSSQRSVEEQQWSESISVTQVEQCGTIEEV